MPTLREKKSARFYTWSGISGGLGDGSDGGGVDGKDTEAEKNSEGKKNSEDVEDGDDVKSSDEVEEGDDADSRDVAVDGDETVTAFEREGWGKWMMRAARTVTTAKTRTTAKTVMTGRRRRGR
ncbi:hypothetical protein PHYPSEUDO_003027 [Phytophthora pseudosyringae]|uniref:Uncharacterized protein n=1 Tax=Phytophthora pseudosyringae TaxID=221518 RepID=A0A8T1VS44_9STRA|nr:hypothetical protein PHYPSEUDO_003027 [Phytophthora pseudosyringae]